MDIVFIIGGLVLLILGGEFLLKGAVSVSLKLQIPKSVIGMTVVSFATSAPELIVSIQSALENHADIALGNVVGSNIANLGFVLGVTLVFTKMDIGRSFAKIDWPIMVLASVTLFFFLYFDGGIDRFEGLIFILLLLIYLFIYLSYYKKSSFYQRDLADGIVVEEEIEEEGIGPVKTLLFLGAGGIALWGGSELLIDGAVSLATTLGVSERIIGITVISIGTSIPELAASLIAVYKKEKAISLGNLIGSNIFNIFAVLGITSMVHPFELRDSRLMDADILWMLGFAFAILPMIYAPNRRKLAWKEGVVLLVAYIVFVYTTVNS